MIFEGKFWIDPAGTVHAVTTCHEEWAHESRGKSLEALLDGGWIRVQAFPGLYLLVDHARATVTGDQGAALAGFLSAPEGQPIRYPRMVVQKHREGDDEREFIEDENAAALKFAREACI